MDFQSLVEFDKESLEWIVYDPMEETQKDSSVSEEFDAEGLIVFEPEPMEEASSINFRGLETESQEDSEFHDEFDAESLIIFDPEPMEEVQDGEESSSRNFQELMAESQEDSELHDEVDAESVILFDPEPMEEAQDGEEPSSRNFQELMAESQEDSELHDEFYGESVILFDPEAIDEAENDHLALDVDETSSSNFQASVPEVDTYKGRPKRGRHLKIPNQSRADRKRMLNTNRTHINSKGKVHQELLFDANFECLCSRNCSQRVDVADRRRLFSQFWGAGQFDTRCMILVNCVKNPRKPTNTDEQTRSRAVPDEYSIFGTSVCKKAILGILQINECRIKTALFKYWNSEVIKDDRGQLSGGRNALPESKVAEVKVHIAAFPKYVSHYTRGKTESKFLSGDLSLAKMYYLYKAEADNPVSQSFYQDIFYKNFNLRFKQPKKDTCLKCDLYATKKKCSVGLDLKMIEEWHEAHLLEANALSTQMKNDCKAAENDDELETLTYDMQKTLPLPKLSTSIAYYKRQLNLYNLGIHSGSTGRGQFNLWMESEASKGTQEVGSCLKLHIESITKPIKKLVLWSDSCGGQNRSIKLVLMMMFVLQSHKTLESISMRYLQSGHSFLPNDREFGEAETALKKHNNLYTDGQYMDVMKGCRIKNKFDVNRMSPNNFFSIGHLESLITNRKTDVMKQKVSWLGTHEILINKNQPGLLNMAKKIGGPFQTVNIKKVGCPLDFENVVLGNLWPTGRPLSKEKLKDLREMVPLVSPECRQFYDFLDDVQEADIMDDIDGFGEFIDFEIDNEE